MQCTLADVAAMGLTPGDPFGIARITKESSVAKPEAKGGELARLAGIWCNEPQFGDWLTSIGRETNNASEAAYWIRKICIVESRADLDHDDKAAERFQRLIRAPYMEWLKMQP